MPPLVYDRRRHTVMTEEFIHYTEHEDVPNYVRQTIKNLADWLKRESNPSSDDPYLASEEHLRLHDMAVGVPKCAVVPCRVAGVSLALQEACAYAMGLVGGRAHLGFADAVEEFEAALAKAHEKLRPSGQRLSREMAVLHLTEQSVSSRSRLHAHSLTCVRVMTLVRTIELLRPVTHEFGADLRTQSLSPLLWEGQPSVGRPPERLLTAMTQHLRRAGIPCAEIPKLLVDDGGTKSRASVVARVRRRAALPDARTIDTSPPMPPIAKETPIGFRARAVQSQIGDRDLRSPQCEVPSSSSKKSPKKRERP